MLTNDHIRQAVLIRRVEDALLQLAKSGAVRGPVHTCNGQEFSALAFCSPLETDDLVFSTHRCHGHYLARTWDVQGLIAELIGKKNGVCGGVGASQHLCNGTFFSNGIQGGGVPIAAGAAFGLKKSKKQNVVVCYIGDGTLGEGVVYETFNLASLLQLPLLIVCENNSYAQTTRISDNLAGSIIDRAAAFGLKVFQSSTWDVEGLFTDAVASLDFVRQHGPAFHLVNTYRLNNHSRSSDHRDADEVHRFSLIDPLVSFSEKRPEVVQRFEEEADAEIAECVEKISFERELSINEYVQHDDFVDGPFDALPEPTFKVNDGETVADRINQFFHAVMKIDPRVMFIGEDVLSPYGGAFKVAAGLSAQFTEQVVSTPISEAGIVGLANGLTLSGYKPYVEIMFGDFLTLAVDQIVNHSTKFRHMYNRQVTCGLVVRAPMGGGMGFGPTHSQTLDKMFVGIDGLSVFAINSLIDPVCIYEAIRRNESGPVLVLENKRDYFRTVEVPSIRGHASAVVTEDNFPVAKVAPTGSVAHVTVTTYGGIAKEVLESLKVLAETHGLFFELLVLSKISPLRMDNVLASLRTTRRLIVVEEGSVDYGVGSEIVCRAAEILGTDLAFASRIGALPVPVPAAPNLEAAVLPSGRLKALLLSELEKMGA